MTKKAAISNQRAISVFNKLVDLTVNRLIQSRDAYFSGNSLDPENRNLNKDCGYPEGEPTVEQYRELYERCDVANRVVSVFSDESWSAPPTVYQTEDDQVTKFERVFDKLVKQHNPWHYLERLDEMSGIGRYGVVVYGIGDGRKLTDPVEGMLPNGRIDPKWAKKKKDPVDLLFIRPYPEYMVDIQEFENDPNSPRNGMPKLYRIKTVDPRDQEQLDETSVIPNLNEVDVHWHRVHHVADNCGASDMVGMPRLKPVMNRVLDVRKTAGGSAEMFYRGAFPGISFETYPELTEEADLDSTSVKAEIEAYSNGFQRYLRLIGMTAKSLAPQVADPSNHLTAQLQLICATLKVPLAIFLGNEAAHLASAQNMTNWMRRLGKRLAQHVTPKLVRGFIDRMMIYGVLPYVEDYIVQWPDLTSTGVSEKAQVGMQKAQALLQYVTSGSFLLVPPRTFLQHVIGFTPAETDAVILAAGGEEQVIAKLTKALNPPNAQNAQTDPSKKRNGQ